MSQHLFFRSQKHPYLPLNAQIPKYIPNENSLPELFAAFATTCAVVLSATAILVKALNPKIVKLDVLIALWFTLCGCIHVFFEGYFIFNFADLASQQTIPAQLWKEYALSDSRYVTQNTFVICLESITVAITGPLALYTALQTARSKPNRHILQLVVSIAHIYSDALYYVTSMFDATVHGIHYSRPEPLYVWGYFAGANGFWILVPLLLIYKSTKKPMKAITAYERSEQRIKRLGVASWRSDMITSLQRKERDRVVKQDQKAD